MRNIGYCDAFKCLPGKEHEVDFKKDRLTPFLMEAVKDLKEQSLGCFSQESSESSESSDEPDEQTVQPVVLDPRSDASLPWSFLEDSNYAPTLEEVLRPNTFCNSPQLPIVISLGGDDELEEATNPFWHVLAKDEKE